MLHPDSLVTSQRPHPVSIITLRIRFQHSDHTHLFPLLLTALFLYSSIFHSLCLSLSPPIFLFLAPPLTCLCLFLSHFLSPSLSLTALICLLHSLFPYIFFSSLVFLAHPSASTTTFLLNAVLLNPCQWQMWTLFSHIRRLRTKEVALCLASNTISKTLIEYWHLLNGAFCQESWQSTILSNVLFFEEISGFKSLTLINYFIINFIWNMLWQEHIWPCGGDIGLIYLIILLWKVLIYVKAQNTNQNQKNTLYSEVLTYTVTIIFYSYVVIPVKRLPLCE